MNQPHRSRLHLREAVTSLSLVAAILFNGGACFAQEASSSTAWKSDPDVRAELYLEDLQRTSTVQFIPPTPRRAATQEEVDSDFDRSIHKVAQSFNLTVAEEAEFRSRQIERRRLFGNRTPQSPYEDPGLYWVMQFWSEKIKNAARLNVKPHGLLDGIHVAMGTLPTGEVNALTISVPSNPDAYVIAFESGLFPFANLISLAFASTLPVERREHGYAVFSVNPAVVLDHVRQHPELLLRFRRLILAYLVEGRFDTLPSSYYAVEDPIQDGMAVMLYTAAGMFVIAHEYGHIVRGHLAKGRRVAAMVGRRSIEKIPHDWYQELEADAIGIDLVFWAFKELGKANLASVIAGAEFFFDCYDIVERSASVIATGTTKRDATLEDHPPAGVRRKYIRENLHDYLQRLYPKDFSEAEWQEALRQAAQFSEIMSQLYLLTEPSLRELHAKGISLAPVWRQVVRDGDR
jgi:hypothetical protein